MSGGIQGIFCNFTVFQHMLKFHLGTMMNGKRWETTVGHSMKFSNILKNPKTTKMKKLFTKIQNITEKAIKE